MRRYEVVYIIDPSVSEEGVNAKLAKFHEVATAAKGAEVLAVDPWGSRQLQYPIGKHRTGHYIVAHIQMAPDDLPEFERIVRLDEEVIRYLVVVNEGEPTDGSSLVAERPESATARDEDEDDDDDDEDEPEAEDAEDDENRRGPAEFAGGRGRRRRIEGPSITLLNYKDVDTLSKFMTEQGKILPRRTTKVTAAFQRRLGTAVKRARFLALIPYVRNHEA